MAELGRENYGLPVAGRVALRRSGVSAGGRLAPPPGVLECHRKSQICELWKMWISGFPMWYPGMGCASRRRQNPYGIPGIRVFEVAVASGTTLRNFAILQPTNPFPCNAEKSENGWRNAECGQGKVPGDSCARLDRRRVDFVKQALDRLASGPARGRACGFPAMHGGLVHAEACREGRLALAEPVTGSSNHFRCN